MQSSTHAPATLQTLLSQAGVVLEGAVHEPIANEQLQSPPLPWLVDALATLSQLRVGPEVLQAAVLAACDVPPAAVAPALLPLMEGQAAEARVVALHGGADAGANAEGLRRLLLAMLRDLRVVPLLLARRLGELRHALANPDEGVEALARVVHDIHAPLANRLGIWQLKWALEDLSMRALQPGEYRRIATLLDENRRDRDADIATAIATLDQALRTHGIHAAVDGRAKHIASIARTLARKRKSFEALKDVRALRVLVDETAECYTALGIVHAQWTPVPGEFDDYIARPKPNGYQSLHTAVIGPGGRVYEVQFRTRAMHAQAELGIAAHWRYKEGGAGDAALEQRVAWIRGLLAQPAEGAALGAELVDALASERIYVLTPRGDVIELPAGSTALDFAYRLHTAVGHRCRGARVDGRIVSLDTVLHSGERVELMLGREAAPRRDWLLGTRFLASSRAREKVRAWFRRLDHERNITAGQALLERELRRAGLLRAPLDPALQQLRMNVDELHIKLAMGDLRPGRVVRLLQDAARAAAVHTVSDTPSAPARTGPDRRAPSGVPRLRVGGLDGLVTTLAQCCAPAPGEAVLAYLSHAHQLRLHRAGCPSLQRMAALHPERVLDAGWQ